jgi:DNA-binding CsgD family transcriptional regulator
MAAFERAAELTADTAERARRLLLGAESGLLSGNLPDAVRLAERAGTTVQEPAFLAQVAWVEGRAWFWQGVHKTAYELMTAGADLDPDSAALLLVHAFHPAWHLGEPQLTDCLDRLSRLDHPVARFQVASMRGRPTALSEVAATLGSSPSDLVLLCGLGLVAGQDTQTRELATTVAARCRAEGTVGLLPTLLFFLASAELFGGRHRDAAVSLDEGLRVARDGDQPMWVSQVVAVQALLSAIEGDEARCRELATEARAGIASGGQAWDLWALGLLDLGAGRAEPALTQLESLQENPYTHQVCAHRSIPDLVEAAVRAGQPSRATEPLRRFTAWADRVGQDWARALVHRCQAMLRGDESDYLAALSSGARPFEQARTELLYGEWLRRGKRKAEARVRFQRALATFERLGARPWAQRVRTELTATGLRVPGEAAPVASPLTPQELQITRLAGRGLSNKDIAAQLFLSPKTVAYHLYKAYPKLGVGSRSELSSLGL